jgi:hypothetical protein
MSRALVWFAAILTSGAVHLALFVVAPQWFAPEPIEDQPRPKSELRIETQEVARSESDAVAPAGERTETTNPVGSAVSQGAIPQSRAEAEPVSAQRLSEAAPPAAIAPVVTEAAVVLAIDGPAPVALEAAPDTGTTAMAEVVVADRVVASATPATTVIANEPLQAAVIEVSAPRPETLGQVQPPPAIAATQDLASVAPTVLASLPDDPALASSVTSGEVAPQAQAPAETLPQSELPADAMTASLAWSGGEDSQIDPQALATIQSFMRPGDIGAQSGDVRDAMTDLLSQVPCARLQAEFDPETGSIVLRGHIPEEGLRAPVLSALQAQVGTGLPVVDAMLILPRPQCGALAGIGTVGLPQSTEALTNPLLVGADAHARAYSYTEGQQLVLDMQAPDYDAYVYVDYFDASGNVIHLIPNDIVPLTLHPAKSAMRIGESMNGEPALAITIGPPFGQEIAVAFAASAPLYDGLRPISEPAEPYLEWLRDRVAEARAADPDFKGEWVYFFISTRGQ